MRMNSISSATRNERGGAAAPRVALDLQFAVPRRGLPSEAQFRQWARAALFEHAQVSLRIVGEEEGRALNRNFRGKDYATNVLSFPYSDASPLSGDIAMCLPVIAREAAQQRKTLAAHLAHLTVHGMLHLQGFDHQRAIDAELMEGLETEILAGLGYDDPYTYE